MSKERRILTYDEMLTHSPDRFLWNTDAYFKEVTPEATEEARKRCWLRLGITVRFLQDHGLTRRILCETAPDIPDDFRVYLRDITPEALEFYRTGYMKWIKRFERNMHADPSDVRVMEKALAEMRAKRK